MSHPGRLTTALGITWSLGIIGSLGSVHASIKGGGDPIRDMGWDFCKDGKIMWVQDQPRQLMKPDWNVTLRAH